MSANQHTFSEISRASGECEKNLMVIVKFQWDRHYHGATRCLRQIIYVSSLDISNYLAHPSIIVD